MAEILHQSGRETKLPVRTYMGDKCISFMQDSTLNLAARGFGRSSFRFCEIVHFNPVPVCSYDDHDWTAYKKSPASAKSIGLFAFN